MGIYEKYTFNLMVNDRNLSFQDQEEDRISALTFLFNILQEVLARAIKQEKKGTQTGKEEEKLSLFTKDMILVMQDLYTEKYKTLTEIIENLNKWKDNSFSWPAKLNIIRMPIIPKLIYIAMQSL